jgi:hypothetical protein
VKTEALIETAELSIVRVHGRPREPEQGRHRRAIVYCSVTTSTGELIRLLRDAAAALEERVPE